MRLTILSLAATVTAALLWSCSGGAPSTPASSNSQSPLGSKQSGHMLPQWSPLTSLVSEGMRPHGPAPLHGIPPPHHGPGIGAIYVSEYYSTNIYAYPHRNTANNPPTCEIGGVSYPNDIASDNPGNVIDPDGATRTIKVFQGKGQCGSQLGSINDIYGQPSDASSANAMTSTVAVANVFDVQTGGGSISVCSMSAGCTANLINANMYEVAGVAMAKNGDCWASAVNSSGQATLTWFQGCTGAGVTATGYQNSYAGGLDIDINGNLMSLSANDAMAYVYSGCNPACTLVSGPFTLEGESAFGHFNKQSMTYAAADFQYGQIDIYKYNSKKSTLTYWYSFNNGLSAVNIVEGVAFAPRSKQ